MAKYSLSNTSTGAQAITTAYKSLLAVWATTDNNCIARRGKIYDVLVGTDGTPADNFMTWDISRSTTTGTGAAGNMRPLDPADVASSASAGIDFSSEPTITSSSSVFSVGVNQRASYRWVAAPGGELLYPATNDNGLALRALSGGYTGTATGTVHVDEQ